MIAAMCHLYRVTGKEEYLAAAKKAQEFIEKYLCENDTLYVSYRNGMRSKKGFLDDYANEIFALLALYEATLDGIYLERAQQFCEKVISDFYDEGRGGFFLYGKDSEQLILRPKETYDGAIPSGNSVMAYNLVQLYLITGKKEFEDLAKRQLGFIGSEAEQYPVAHAMFLSALLDDIEMPDKITIVVKDRQVLAELSCKIPLNTVVCIIEEPSKEYPLKNNRTTFYMCKGHSCFQPSNELIS